VLALDALRALDALEGMGLVRRELGFILQGVRDPALVRISALVEQAADEQQAWLEQVLRRGEAAREAGARRFALSLGRTLTLALLARHAQWALEHERDSRPLAAARRLAASEINSLADVDATDTRRLAVDGQ
jgi:acyl-CoA dehydrogenase